jgi:ATP-binding cassette subfamily F protein uup
MLARALAKPSNWLVLDEPTNDLDMETLDVLEEMLGNYAGTVILISHDRDFLDRVVSSVIVPEGDGRWTEYAGGYSDMLAQRKADVVSRKPAVREPAREKTQAPAQPKAAKRKLSFHEKHALEMLPGEMAKMQADVRRLQSQLADPNLYGRDRAAFTQATNALTQALGQLASAEERWLELEILREEMGE